MKALQIVILLAVVLAVLCSAASVAQAQELESYRDKNIFQKGGAIGYVIVILSIVGLALVIEDFVSLRRDKMAPPDLVTELDTLLQDEEYDQALKLCDAERTPLTNIMAAGLPKLAAGYDPMALAIREATDNEAMKLYTKISYIALVAQVAPMLGLLGTVQGMIAAFDVIASVESPKPSELADGIGAALVTTLFGLIVAIPMLGFYAYFKNIVSKIANDLGSITMEMVERFRPLQQS